MTSHQVHGSYCFHQYLEEAHSLVSTSVTLAPRVTCHPYSVTAATLVRHHLFSSSCVSLVLVLVPHCLWWALMCTLTACGGPSCVPSLLVVGPHVYPHCLWWALMCTFTVCGGPSCVPSLFVVGPHVYPHCLWWALTASGGPSYAPCLSSCYPLCIITACKLFKFVGFLGFRGSGRATCRAGRECG